MRHRTLALLAVLAAGCGGSTSGSGAPRGADLTDGGGAAGSGGSSSSAGGASSGGSRGSGGSSNAGGLPSTGGAQSAGGSGAGGGVNCANVGCGAPFVCTEGCGAPCGCCPCAEGQVVAMSGASYVCKGGCYAPIGDAAAPGCDFQGQTYPVGSTLNAGDGCNTCTCTAPAQLGCTKKACACDPTSDHEKHHMSYVSTTSPCGAIPYHCISGTTSFQNACGCGCEQAPSCPDWFDCMPSPGTPPCDAQKIHAECPFSGIAY